jgi:hypothetical protein
MGKKKKEEYVSLFNTYTHKNLLMTVKTSLTSILKKDYYHIDIKSKRKLKKDLRLLKHNKFEFKPMYCIVRKNKHN